MLDHLLDFNPDVSEHDKSAVPIEKTTPAETISAQLETADWLKSLGAVDVDQVTTRLETDAARKAFNGVVTAKPNVDTHHQLAQIKTPEAVRHLVGMLTAYDWEFVQQAKEIRGYTVAKLIEETENPSANIRLKALALLGKVTEVGLFTDKIEVKKTDLTEDEVDKKLREKLERFMDISDADIIDVEPLHTNPTTTDDNQPSSNA
tara:strand:- start:672 stop:1286 length:615 start_codon:yes stop_codon:yes gene_type:complete